MTSDRVPHFPSWHFSKVRVQGSCVLCAHGPALFIPNQPIFFFFSCARIERCSTKVMDMDFLWFDSMKRSVEGTMKWQWGLHVVLTGTGVLTSPWNGSDWALLRPFSWEQGGSDGPRWPCLVPRQSRSEWNKLSQWGGRKLLKWNQSWKS